MSPNKLQHQVAYLRKSLFDQGYLDEQFIQLEDLQDEANPNFVEDVVTLFYSDSARLLKYLEEALESRHFDCTKLDDCIHQFKGSASSIGAKRVKDLCTWFKECCATGNIEGCIRAFQQVKQEHTSLRRKLETYFQLQRQARASGQGD